MIHVIWEEDIAHFSMSLNNFSWVVWSKKSENNIRLGGKTKSKVKKIWMGCIKKPIINKMEFNKYKCTSPFTYRKITSVRGERSGLRVVWVQKLGVCNHSQNQYEPTAIIMGRLDRKSGRLLSEYIMQCLHQRVYFYFHIS